MFDKGFLNAPEWLLRGAVKSQAILHTLAVEVNVKLNKCW
jgi:hypothetical protein